MNLVLFFVALAVTSCGCVPEEAYCCKAEQGYMSDSENFCILADTNGNITKTHGRLPCETLTYVSKTDIDFLIADNGRLIMKLEKFENQIEIEEYCLANRSSNRDDDIVVACLLPEEENIIDGKTLAACCFVSAVFLTLTSIVYCALPEMRDLQGKSIINFCLSLAIGLCILGEAKVDTNSLDMEICATRGFLIYFFLIAAFFWMNAIAIQLLFSIRRPSKLDYGWKDFLWYALYAWGGPTVLTVIMAIVNFHPGYHRKPGIGFSLKCWFSDNTSQWHYMYSVMTILIAANIAIFVYITIYLWRQTFSSSHIKALKYKVHMTARMFIIMGLPWIFEMISSLFKAQLIWAMIDIFNVLSGIFIFLLLVVFRKRVIKAMYRRGWLNCIAGTVERRLAIADDDEEDVVHQTVDVSLQEGLPR